MSVAESCMYCGGLQLIAVRVGAAFDGLGLGIDRGTLDKPVMISVQQCRFANLLRSA